MKFGNSLAIFLPLCAITCSAFNANLQARSLTNNVVKNSWSHSSFSVSSSATVSSYNGRYAPLKMSVIDVEQNDNDHGRFHKLVS